jgi:hypothetical protein
MSTSVADYILSKLKPFKMREVERFAEIRDGKIVSRLYAHEYEPQQIEVTGYEFQYLQELIHNGAILDTPKGCIAVVEINQECRASNVTGGSRYFAKFNFYERIE